MPYVDPHIWNVQIQCSFLQNFTVESTSVNVIKKNRFYDYKEGGQYVV